MKTSRRSGGILVAPRLIGPLACLVLAGCALTRPPEEAKPSDSEVNIGYGSVDEGHVVGSATTVRMEDQPLVHVHTIADILAKIPGVRVIEGQGGAVSVRIRGTNSILADEEPLWVIDGMIVQTGGGLAGINPSTIESITVLKDAGSTAIYGSRGANGVILIRTKK